MLGSGGRRVLRVKAFLDRGVGAWENLSEASGGSLH